MSRQVNPSSSDAAPAGSAALRGKRPFLAVGAMVASLIACYGTLALIAVLSSFGIALSPDQEIVKGVIITMTLLAVLVVAYGSARRGALLPLIPAVCGGALMLYVMRVDFDRMLEALAFALVAAGAMLDWHLRRKDRCRAPGFDHG